SGLSIILLDEESNTPLGYSAHAAACRWKRNAALPSAPAGSVVIQWTHDREPDCRRRWRVAPPPTHCLCRTPHMRQQAPASGRLEAGSALVGVSLGARSEEYVAG